MNTDAQNEAAEGFATTGLTLNTDAQNEASEGSANRWGARCLKPSRTLGSALCKDMVWFVAMIPIVSHQSTVLLPLTNFHASPVCSTIETPAGINSQTTACLAKWAMAALPYGIPMIFGGVLCGALALALEKVKPLMILFGFAGFVFITTGVCFGCSADLFSESTSPWALRTCWRILRSSNYLVSLVPPLRQPSLPSCNRSCNVFFIGLL